MLRPIVPKPGAKRMGIPSNSNLVVLEEVIINLDQIMRVESGNECVNPRIVFIGGKERLITLADYKKLVHIIGG